MRVGWTGNSLFASLRVDMRFSTGRTTLCRVAEKIRGCGEESWKFSGKANDLTEMESSHTVRWAFSISPASLDPGKMRYINPWRRKVLQRKWKFLSGFHIVMRYEGQANDAQYYLEHGEIRNWIVKVFYFLGTSQGKNRHINQPYQTLTVNMYLIYLYTC